MPYKRYQIGNVWRNEKAGNARYREFCQADCDIIGKVNLFGEKLITYKIK